MRTRSKQLNFRLTENEYFRIKSKSDRARVSVSAFILSSALDKTILVVEDLKPILVELKRIGTNLNQLTRLANEGKINCLNLNTIQNELKGIWGSLNSVHRKEV